MNTSQVKRITRKSTKFNNQWLVDIPSLKLFHIIMKNTFFNLAMIIAVMASCHSVDKDEYPSVNNDISNIDVATLKAKFNGLEPLMGLKNSSFPRARTGSVRTEKEVRDFSEQLSFQRKKLAQEAKIPIHMKGAPLTMSLKQAQIEYASFMSKNKNDEKYLSLFVQVFAPQILNDYGLLDTDDYSSIHSYLTDLISASSNDFATMTLCIAKLQKSDRFKVEELEPLINKVVDMAEKRYKAEQEVLPLVLKMNENLIRKKQSKTADNGDRLILTGTDDMIEKLKNSDAKTCIELLRGNK